ncbi:MAG: 50S ribosomal protein L21 [Alphaproteobacteria bacterium]
MFAIIRTGGKQYKVKSGDLVFVEKLEHATGDHVVFEDILMIGDETKTTVGSPTLAGAKVGGVVVNQDRADKVIIFKKTRRHTYKRKKGHRQHRTIVRIMEISLSGVLHGAKPAANEKVSTAKPVAAAEPKQKAAPKAAPKKASAAKAQKASE